MKKKIGLGILALLAVAIVYGAIQLMPLINVLKEVDISDFAPPEIEEEESIVPQDTSTDDTNEVENELENSADKDLSDSGNRNTDDSSSDNNETAKVDNQSKSNQEKKNTQKADKSNTTNKDNQAIAISSDKIESVEKEISFADKAKAVKLIVSNLSASDIKMLKDLASGGLTPEEKAKAVKIAYSKYSDEELKVIKELYKKYVGK